MAKEKRAFWRKWVWKHLLAGITVLAMSSAAVGKDVVPDEARTRDMMRCQDYLQLDPRAWTPMVIWLMNDPFHWSRRSGTDFHEAELGADADPHRNLPSGAGCLAHLAAGTAQFLSAGAVAELSDRGKNGRKSD